MCRVVGDESSTGPDRHLQREAPRDTRSIEGPAVFCSRPMDITDEWGIESSCRFSFPQELQLELGAGSEAGTSGRLCLPEKCPLPGTLHPLALAKLQRSVSTTTSTSSTAQPVAPPRPAHRQPAPHCCHPRETLTETVNGKKEDAVDFLLLEVLEGDAGQSVWEHPPATLLGAQDGQRAQPGVSSSIRSRRRWRSRRR